MFYVIREELRTAATTLGFKPATLRQWRRRRAHSGRCEIPPNRVEDAQLIIDHYIPLPDKDADLGKFLLLMNIDEHAAFESRPEPGALNLPRLEDRIAIREDEHASPRKPLSSTPSPTAP